MPASHADRARLAHRALRLLELGYQDERKSELLSLAEGSPELTSDRGTHPVLRLARGLADATETLRPGVTDEKYVTDLLAMTWDERFEEWRSHADAACQAEDPEGYAAAQESIARDRGAREEADAEMMRTGRWPERTDFIHHAAAQSSLEETGGLANALFDLGREGFLAGEIDWDTATMKVIAVDTGLYTVDLATHKFVSSIAAGARVATSAALASKTVAAGVADAADITYAGLTGASIEALAIMQSSAVGGGADVADTAQRLIAFLDTATGLPFTPSGADLTVTWDNGSNRIFKL